MPEFQEVNHIKNFHHEICSLLIPNKWWTSIIDAMLEDYKYIYSGESNILSENTTKKMNIFVVELEKYLSLNVYSREYILVLFDIKWQVIINKFLIPTIREIENDLESNCIEYAHYLSYLEPSNRPSEDEIFEKMHFMHKLLIDNNLMGK